MRDEDAGLEVLLLRRNRHAGFVPEMYVFPGGRVDAADADPAALARLDHLTPEAAATRLDLQGAEPPAIAYFMAAFREAFEEAGILVGSRADGSRQPTAAEDPDVDLIRDDLMESRIEFGEVLARLDCRISGDAVAYFAHWITPRREPRRFDTRFFAARVEAGSTATVDPREMTDARWLSPLAALAEHHGGALPMILPTVQTLERLSTFTSAVDALETLALDTVVTILPGG